MPTFAPVNLTKRIFADAFLAEKIQQMYPFPKHLLAGDTGQKNVSPFLIQ